MISRRNIRVKVMQLLYIIESTGDEQYFKNPISELENNIDKSRALFIYLLYNLTEVARYAETDSVNRASKNLPSSADLNVNTKIAGNELLWQILENPSFKKSIDLDKPSLRVDKGLIKKLYQELANSEVYNNYINELGREKKKEKQLMEYIFNQLLLPNQNFEEHITDQFNNWDDDAEMMQQLINNFLEKPTQDITTIISADKLKFAKNLLATMLDKKDYALELIKPKLKNWDSERIALLDMILMQLGICELLYFETIPTKVSINEYIDLAKAYSTPQSGQFVNGVLDSIHKELFESGKINKIAYKKNNPQN